MRSVYWTPEATRDREDIYNRIEADNLAAAADLDELFQEKAMLLAKHPALGRLGRVAGTRELIVHRNYMVIYDAPGQVVRILRLLHARRRWPPE